MARYRKKPVEIEALKLTHETYYDCVEFLYGHIYSMEPHSITISTLEGNMKASMGDYIIKGVQGEFYPCKPDIFEQTYESVY